MEVQGESIYNLLPRPQEVPVRPERHNSSFAGKVDPKNFTFGQNKAQLHATFGLPNGCNSQHPTQYTRKHEKEPVLPDPKPPSNPKTKLRPPVPAKEDAPVMGLQSNKNFITTNAVQVILAKPQKVPQEEFVWTMRPGYGSTPLYLRRNKQRVAYEKEQFEQYVRMRQEPAANASVSQLSSSERSELLRHLKRKWASLNDAYQRLPLSTDSEQKKHRKEELERMLAETEKDIKTLERGETVLVVDE
ncbi:flagellar associated protein [Haematococcus lacustris]